MIDKTDLALLAQLRKNSRTKLTRMSREIDIPVSTIFERLKGPLRKYIKRFTCLINNAEVGFNSRATIILKVDKEQKEEIRAFLEKHQNVNSLYRINNGYDFLLDTIFGQMIDLEEFIEQLEKRFRIKHKEVYFIIDEIKQEGFLADPQAVAFLLGKQPQPLKAAKRAKEAKDKQ
ncbi:MAG: Lrp/AsnC family transcriptional regulator [Nanoarchaeota archaeon]